MEPHGEKYRNLYIKHLTGGASPEERRELFTWLEEDPDRKALVEDLEKTWQRTAAYETPAFDVAEAWEKVQGRMRKKMQVPEQRSFRRYINNPVLVAASIALLILATSLFLLLKPSSMVNVSTAAGETKELLLPDGSTVFLNGNSSLTYDRRLTRQDERRVNLTGEAFFRVTKNVEKPFIVSAGKTETKVLGTTFNVHAAASGEEVTVSLMTGKVQFGVPGKTRPILLDPGYEAVYDQNNGSLTTQQYPNANFLFWKNRKLVFTDERLANVLASIGKNYQASFQMEDTALKNRRLTSTFDHRSLDEVLNVLETLLDIRIQQTDSIYVVTSKIATE